MLDPRSLRPHPLQATFFRDMDPDAFARLAVDIDEKGIQNPLLLMADGTTVVCGHQRLRAALDVELKYVPCIVRSDLTEPDDPEVIKLLVRDNLHRRHLSTLQQAKCAIELAKMECKRQRKTNEREITRRIEDAVVTQLHGDCEDAKLRKNRCKNAQRYINVANTPLSIQEAFDRELLRLVDAAAVAGLESRAQENLGKAVAEALQETDDERVVKEKIHELVKAELDKAKKQNPKWMRWHRKKIARKRQSRTDIDQACSPLDPLHTINAGMEGNLDSFEQKLDAIVAYITESDDELKRTRSHVVFELHARCNRLVECLGTIEAAIESESVDVENCDDDSEDDEREGEPRTSCLVNNEIALIAV
jgi:hypothetical protein